MPVPGMPRSRARVANGLLLTAPGIPMLFMGQEILEDKYWSDSPDFYADSLIWWDGLAADRRMRDHLRFMQELIRVRRAQRALTRRSHPRVPRPQRQPRDRLSSLARGRGDDVVVVASFSESTW